MIKYLFAALCAENTKAENAITDTYPAEKAYELIVGIFTVIR